MGRGGAGSSEGRSDSDHKTKKISPSGAEELRNVLEKPNDEENHCKAHKNHTFVKILIQLLRRLDAGEVFKFMLSKPAESVNKPGYGKEQAENKHFHHLKIIIAFPIKLSREEALYARRFYRDQGHRQVF